MNNIGTIHSVNNTTGICQAPQLPASVLSAIGTSYRLSQGQAAVEALSNGERDVLEAARVALGWPSIVSLAYKYYPLYPHSSCWKRALYECSKRKIMTATLNIRYLLLAVISQVQQSLEKSYSSTRQAVNRLTHPFKDNTIEVNRLTHPGEVKRPEAPPVDPDKYIKGKYGHLVRR